MPRFPEWTRVDTEVRIIRHVTQYWPALDGVTVRFRGGFAYLEARLRDGEVRPLCRLRYDGSETDSASHSGVPATTTTRTRSDRKSVV